MANNTYDYYNKNTFWNDHYIVREYINKLTTGDKNTNWMKYVYDKYFSGKHGIKVLSVGCGNGWQDRDLDKIFNFDRLTGYDISEDLLQEARKKSPSKKYTYKKADLNKDYFKERDYDLAINLAALHHVENMENVVRETSRALKKDGLFIHFDYIGPKRNQYPDNDLYWMNWIKMALPENLVGREKIERPSIEVMLKEDPSEAVGSEEIIPTLAKYFNFERLRYFNGGLMYQVLYNKIQNFNPKNETQNSLLKICLQLEKEMTSCGKIKPLFAFVVCEKKRNNFMSFLGLKKRKYFF